MAINPVQFILEKRSKKVHSKDAIGEFILGVTTKQIPDYQVSAWLMAAFLNGLNDDEVAALTLAMKNSGWTLNRNKFSKPVADKHSTGGVGDKTTLIIGPIVAAAGIIMPSLAGRGLGFTGGTVDKLESIPGFRTRLSSHQFEEQLNQVGFAISGQSEEICPADRRLYELRDVTATVDSNPLICASILSKKLAEGLDALVLDVKAGNGALMKTQAQAETLGRALKIVGEKNGLKTDVLVTNMSQPLGRFVGNSLEVKECIDILKGEHQLYFEETLDLSLDLAAVMILRTGLMKDLEGAKKLASAVIKNGKAFEKWAELCKAQGATGGELPIAKYQQEIKTKNSGVVGFIDTEKIGWLSIELGAGRIKAEDKIDLAAGMEFHVKVGTSVSSGDALVTLYANDKAKLDSVANKIESAFTWAKNSESVQRDPLVLTRL